MLMSQDWYQCENHKHINHLYYAERLSSLPQDMTAEMTTDKPGIYTPEDDVSAAKHTTWSTCKLSLLMFALLSRRMIATPTPITCISILRFYFLFCDERKGSPLTRVEPGLWCSQAFGIARPAFLIHFKCETVHQEVVITNGR